MSSRFLEGCDHGNRVSGRNEHPENQSAQPLPIGKIVHAEGSDTGGKNHAQRRQDEHHGEVLAQLLPAEVEGSLENERRKKHSKQEFLGEADVRREWHERQDDSSYDQADAVWEAESS